MSKARNLSQLQPDTSGALPSASIGTDAITQDKVADDAIGLDQLSATGTASSSTFLRGDNSWQVVAVTPTAVSDQNNTSTGYFDLPSGTTAQRPGSPAAGFTRYNTTTNTVEFYNGTTWIGTNLIPVVSAVSGVLYVGSTSNLTLTVSNASDTITVRFVKGGTFLADVVNVTVSGGTTATVAVPAAVYNGVSGGEVVTISIINIDYTPSMTSVTTTAVQLPTGGSITTSGGYRYHTFTGSGTFTTYSGYTPSVDLLVVAGGGGGGSGGNGRGGGGAGGAVQQTVSTSASAYSITIGGGGGAGSQGSSSSALGYTATGGGTGASYGAGGGNGGSGGGAPRDGSSYSPGSGTSGQGSRGGFAGGFSCASAGGGGGASQPGNTGKNDCGAPIDPATASAGGDGINWKSLGTYYGGGGGGAYEGASRQIYGGLGGGGLGGSSVTTTQNPTSGSANTGGGGGGGQGGQTSGSGGSGIVVIRYAL